MSTEISFAKLSIEARTEVIKEAMESTLWSLEKSEKEIEFLRARLQEQKEALGHGRWLPWIRETFGDNNATVQKIQRFLRAPESNKSLLIYLDDSTGEVPRSSRKPGRVKVVEPPADHIAEVNEKVDDGTDDDPTPDPPTIRKTAAGSRKVPESEKPPTRPVQAELLPDEPEQSAEMRIKFAVRELSQVLNQIAVSERKKTAKQLRKLADELDPPTKFVPPTLDEVEAYVSSHGYDVDPEGFWAYFDSQNWQKANGRKVSNWQGCVLTFHKKNKEHKANGHAKTTGNGRSRGLTAEDVFSAESLGRGR